jgi:hypothetical protein
MIIADIPQPRKPLTRPSRNTFCSVFDVREIRGFII